MPRYRRILDSFEPYVPGEQPASRQVIKLNTNENPFPPVDGVLEALRELDGESLRRYPDPLCSGLISRLSERYGFPEDGILVGNGSDEILAMAARAFLEPGDTGVITDPTYLLYANIIALHSGSVRTIPLTDEFALPEETFRCEGKLFFLASPNSPNGASFPTDQVARLSDAFRGLLVVDEAYADFSGTDCLDLARCRENVLVVRTFSKAFSLASLRIGFALGCPQTVEKLRRVKDSYNVNLAGQVAGCAALDRWEQAKERIDLIKSERERIRSRVGEMGFRTFPSDANFLLFRTNRPTEIYESLKAKGIYIRYIRTPRLSDCLRVTVGTPEQNAAFLRALSEERATAEGAGNPEGEGSGGGQGRTP